MKSEANFSAANSIIISSDSIDAVLLVEKQFIGKLGLKSYRSHF